MSDAAGSSAQTGGTHEDFLASAQHHTTAGSGQPYVHNWRRLPRAWTWCGGRHRVLPELWRTHAAPCRTIGRRQDSSAPFKPSSCFWTTPPGPGKGFAALEGTTARLVLLEQAGSTWIAYLSHNPDKPSRIIEILQYMTFKSKFS